MKIVSTIDISSSPECVFYWLESPERAQEWMTSVASTRITKKVPGMVGTTFEETVEEGRGKTKLVGTVSGWVPNRSISFRLDGDYNSVDVEFRLEPRGEQTRVIQEAEVRFKSFARLFMLVLGPMFRRKAAAQIKEEFVLLKKLCETSSVGWPNVASKNEVG